MEIPQAPTTTAAAPQDTTAAWEAAGWVSWGPHPLSGGALERLVAAGAVVRNRTTHGDSDRYRGRVAGSPPDEVALWIPATWTQADPHDWEEALSRFDAWDSDNDRAVLAVPTAKGTLVIVCEGGAPDRYTLYRSYIVTDAEAAPMPPTDPKTAE